MTFCARLDSFCRFSGRRRLPKLPHDAGLCDAWMAFSLPRLSCLSVSQARGLYQLVTFKKDSIDLYMSFEYKLDRSPSCRIVIQARVEDARLGGTGFLTVCFPEIKASSWTVRIH